MNTIAVKWSLSAITGALAALLGWSGWLLVMLIGCAVADWITGSAAAWKQGQWSSRKAREGIMSKMGMFMAVLAALIFDLLISLIFRNLPALELPFFSQYSRTTALTMPISSASLPSMGS